MNERWEEKKKKEKTMTTKVGTSQRVSIELVFFFTIILIFLERKLSKGLLRFMLMIEYACCGAAANTTRTTGQKSFAVTILYKNLNTHTRTDTHTCSPTHPHAHAHRHADNNICTCVEKHYACLLRYTICVGFRV